MAVSVSSLGLILLFLLLLLLLNIRKLSKVGRQAAKLPPSPPKLPVLGNLHQLGASPHISFQKLSQQYGPVMLLQLGKNIQNVVISSAEAAKETLKIHDLDLCSRPRLVGPGKLSYNYLDISYSPYGDYWRNIRKLSVIELFNVKRAQTYLFIQEEEVVSMIESISVAASSGTPVNLTEKLFSLTASIIFRIAFGKNFRESTLNNDKFIKMVREAMVVLGSFCASEYFQYVGWIVDRLTGLHGRLERTFQELDSFFQQVLDDHLKLARRQMDGEEDIIDVLLRIVKDKTEFADVSIGKDNIKAVIMDLFLAGVDTSASTVSWAMAELARQPRVMKKAQNEIRNCVGKTCEKVTKEQIEHLEYFKMVVKETLRLHPPAPLLLPREAMAHCTIGGYDICPKTLVQVNVWAIGRDPKYWKSPEHFFPERFTDSSVDFKGQDFELLPFGSGRRICPGMHLGTTNVELALANLLYRFDWMLPDGMKEEDLSMEEAAGPSLTLSRKMPLYLVPVNKFEN